MAYRPSDKTEARKAAMRERLLTAGRELFAVQGFEATTLQQVVQSAGTSIGNCYFYFSDKEALLEAVADGVRQEIAVRVDAAVRALPAGPLRLATAMDVAIAIILTTPDIARLTLAHPPVRAATVAYFTSRSERMFDGATAPAGSPLLIAHAWQGAIFFIAEGAILGRFSETPEEIARFLIGWNLRGLGLTHDEVAEVLRQLEEARTLRQLHEDRQEEIN